MQSDVQNFADDLITAVADTYGDVETRANTPAKRSFVQTQKVEIASSALENAVNVHPFGGLMDTVVLITLVRECNEDPATRDVLGTDYPVIERMLVMQEATAWRLAARYLSDDRLAELRRDIAAWRAANPQQRYVAHVHLIDFLIANPNLSQAQARNPGSIFALLFIDPLSGIDPAVRELEQSRDTAERMFFYMQRLPLLISWRVEIQYQQMLSTPQVGQAARGCHFADGEQRSVCERGGGYIEIGGGVSEANLSRAGRGDRSTVAGDDHLERCGDYAGDDTVCGGAGGGDCAAFGFSACGGGGAGEEYECGAERFNRSVLSAAAMGVDRDDWGVFRGIDWVSGDCLEDWGARETVALKLLTAASFVVGRFVSGV